MDGKLPGKDDCVGGQATKKRTESRTKRYVWQAHPAQGARIDLKLIELSTAILEKILYSTTEFIARWVLKSYENKISQRVVLS